MGMMSGMGLMLVLGMLHYNSVLAYLYFISNDHLCFYIFLRITINTLSYIAFFKKREGKDRRIRLFSHLLTILICKPKDQWVRWKKYKVADTFYHLGSSPNILYYCKKYCHARIDLIAHKRHCMKRRIWTPVTIAVLSHHLTR